MAALLLLPLADARAQVTQRFPDEPVTATSIVDFDGQTWVGTPDGAYRISGDNCVRVPDFKMDVNGIYIAAGHIWLATTEGAFRIDGDRAVRVPDRGLVVTSVSEVAGRVWLAATNGAYLVDGDDARRTPDRDLDVAAIVSVAGEPWLATDHGAIALTSSRRGSQSARPLPEAGRGALETRSSWELGMAEKPSDEEFTATHLVNIDYGLNQIVEMDGFGWLATDQGAFRVNPADLSYKHIELITPANPAYRFTKKLMEVFHIIKAQGQIWFIGRAGAFRVDGDVAHRIPDLHLDTATIVDAGGHVWLATQQGAYRVDGDTARRIPDIALSVSGVTQIGSRVWLATDQGAYAVDGDNVRRIPDAALSVASVTQVGGQTFLATQNGAYLVYKDQAYPVIDSSMNVMSVYGSGDNAWMVTPEGAFRVDPTRRVGVRLIPRDTAWTSVLRRLLPPGLTLTGDYGLRAVYEDWDGRVDGPAPQARVIAATSRTAYDAALAAGSLADPAAITVRILPGQAYVYVGVKDGWLPIVDRTIAVRPVAPAAVVLGWIALLWLFKLVIVVALAPWSMTCHRLLMHRGFRSAGSLGLIPLALMLFPGLRRHLLRRFRSGLVDGLGSDTPFDDAAAVERLAARLHAERVTAYPPPNGVEPFVTACHLARLALPSTLESSAETAGYTPTVRTESDVPRFGFEKHGDAVPHRSRRDAPSGKESPLARLGDRAIPMPLLASGNEVERLDAVAAGLLSEYGAITDPSFARWLIARGGFLFIVEGETPNALTIPAVDAFCARRRSDSYVCLVR